MTQNTLPRNKTFCGYIVGKGDPRNLRVVTSEMLYPGIPAAMLGISGIALADICLALKRYIAVGLERTAVLNEAHDPLQHVPDEKGQPEHFALLQQVDVFVPHQRW